MRGPFARWPRVSDAVLAFLTLAFTLGIWSSEHPEEATQSALPFFAFVLFAAGSAALFWRRRRPGVVHGIVLTASALSMRFGYLQGPIFALVVSLYSLGRYCADDRRSYFGVGVAIALLAVGGFVVGTPSFDGASMLGAFIAWYAGRRVRARGEYLRLLQERAAQLEREQQAEADRAVADERTRIARELHDIVAHQVSLMTVQAGAAKTVAAQDPRAAAQAMAAVEEAGRKALDELRHLLGVLRPGGKAGELGPQPGSADIPRLIEGLERAGLSVSLSLENGRSEWPARVDLAIYRIVQEALTNVLKHAGPRVRAEVSVRGDARGVTIEVVDDGVGATRLPGSGLGISGMRERVQLLGGRLETRSPAGGGFAVIAFLPASEESR